MKPKQCGATPCTCGNCEKKPGLRAALEALRTKGFTPLQSNRSSPKQGARGIIRGKK